jgi:hypothetical protein
VAHRRQEPCPRKAKVAGLGREAGAIRRNSPLPDDGKGRARLMCSTGSGPRGYRAMPEGFAARQRTGSNGGACGFLLLVNEGFREALPAHRFGAQIKALLFSKIVLEILFLIDYHLNEFR